MAHRKQSYMANTSNSRLSGAARWSCRFSNVIYVSFDHPVGLFQYPIMKTATVVHFAFKLVHIMSEIYTGQIP